MNDKNAYQLLIFLRNSSSETYKIECNALINDRFTIWGLESALSSKNV